MERSIIKTKKNDFKKDEFRLSWMNSIKNYLINKYFNEMVVNKMQACFH